MCQEHYQEWKDCQCRGFVEIKICPELFKTCLGPGGDKDKMVVAVNSGMCNECWGRTMQEAREAAQADEDAEGLAVASASSPSDQSMVSSSVWNDGTITESDWSN